MFANRIANINPPANKENDRMITVKQPMIIPYNQRPRFVFVAEIGSVIIKKPPKIKPPVNKPNSGPATFAGDNK